MKINKAFGNKSNYGKKTFTLTLYPGLEYLKPNAFLNKIFNI